MTAATVAVVTGAAGGIGQAISARLAASGIALALFDNRAGPLQSLATDLENRGGSILPHVVDLQDGAAIEAAFRATCDHFGRIDALINNAAILDDLAPVAEMHPDMWHKVLAVNLTGPYLTCRSAIPIMLAAGGGCILNVSSVAGQRGGRAGAAYTASKFGLIGLTKNIAATYAHLGIRCNAICPGSVRTDIGAGVTLNENGRRLRARDVEMKPAQADPDEIAAVAAFLVSRDAGYVNGAEVTVDGGYLAF